jgi:hypothetical protein
VTPPVSIDTRLYSQDPPIVLVTFIGRITLHEITSNRDFGRIVKSLGERPFRLLCDFTRTLTMPAEVCAVFVKAQEFAVARGMERDALVGTSSVVRLQFARLARESGRATSLGPLHFFDTLVEGAAYLQG